MTENIFTTTKKLEKYSNLTPQHIEIMSNGCGGKGSIVKPPHAVFFEADCDDHDVGYGRGGSERDRLNCDIKLLRAMLNDVAKLPNGEGLSWYSLKGIKQKAHKKKMTSWCYGYFLAVRWKGDKFFSYRAKRLTLQEYWEECVAELNEEKSNKTYGPF